MSEIGLFPLPLVLLPTEQVPLHIFEERYKELIGECLEDDDEFGLVYADDDGVREIGTRAGVVEVLTEFDDGRLNILVEGRERFRMVEVTGGRSFDTAEVAPVDDADDPSDERDDRPRAVAVRAARASSPAARSRCRGPRRRSSRSRSRPGSSSRRT